MNLQRNDQCICGSGKKFKNCCISKNTTNQNRYLRKIIMLGIVLLLLFSGYGIYESLSYPEQEYYKCENPNCTLYHKRNVTDNTNSDNN